MLKIIIPFLLGYFVTTFVLDSLTTAERPRTSPQEPRTISDDQVRIMTVDFYPPIFRNFGSASHRQFQAERAFEDAVILAANVLETPHFEDIYKLYFDSSGDKDEILSVFRNVVGNTTRRTFAPGDVIVDNVDSDKICNHCFAYFYHDLGVPPTGIMVLCNWAYALPYLADINCDYLGDELSFGGIVLHELVYYRGIDKAA